MTQFNTNQENTKRASQVSGPPAVATTNLSTSPLSVPIASAIAPAANGNTAQNQPLPMPGWTPKRVAQATLVAIGVGIVFLLLYRFYMVIFIFFVAVTLQVAMKPTVERLRRWSLRPQVSVGLIYLILLTLVVSFLWFAAPLLIEQTSALSNQLPTAYVQWRDTFLASDNRLIHAIALTLPAELSFTTLKPTAASDGSTLDPLTPIWSSFKTASYIIFILTTIFMLAYYWTLEGDLVTRRLLLLIKPERRDQWRTVLEEMEHKIGDYFRGQALLCLIMATMSTVIYFSLGIPYALGLGLLMGLLDAIPMIGPIIGTIPAIFLALTIDPTKALWIIGAMTVVQQLESTFLIPRIMDNSVGINAIVTILAVAAFGLLFGIGGAILAIPLAATLQILFDRFVLNKAITDETSAAVTPANVAGRSNVSALRVKTQELTTDLRNYMRTMDEGQDEQTAKDEVEDLLEAVAEDLDGLLSNMESTQ